MSENLEKFDSWLNDSGPAAIVLKQPLMPVEGRDGVLFPPTFASSEDGSFKGGYNIDELGNGQNVCIVDTVGSQANRLEPIFARPDYDTLVPQIVVQAGDKHINLLMAGHRAGDAIVRCSPMKAELHQAFLAVQQGDAGPLARVAPTSLVFGAWDSRDTGAKVPRLLASTIRARNVRKLTRSAQYVPAVDYEGLGLLEKAEKKETSDLYSKRGFKHVPASASHGGILLDPERGSILREATLHLVALRLLHAGRDPATTLALRRYILALSLVALTAPPDGFLRQGCNLVVDPQAPGAFDLVFLDGRREALRMGHEEALAYARAAAQAFGVGASRDVRFDEEEAKRDVTPDAEKAAKKERKSKK